MSDVVSKARKTADRANAQVSTGPKTQLGKHRSSQNATPHGLLAQLRPDSNPATGIEQMLVEGVAASLWRLRSAHRCDQQTAHETYESLPHAWQRIERVHDDKLQPDASAKNGHSELGLTL